MPSAADMVAAARARIENLSVDEVQREAEQGALIVDVREPAEREKEGYIDGALPVPRGVLEFWADPASPMHREELDPGRRIVLHCAVGGRSALAAATLQDLGFRDVAHMDGGFTAWKDAGKPVRDG